MGDSDLETRRAADARHRENRARLANANALFESTGLGAIEFEDVHDFGLTFIERPFIAIGHGIDVDALSASLEVDEESAELLLPHVTTYVVEWDRDERGYYVGAWCAANVTFDSQLALPEDVEVVGPALRDVLRGGHQGRPGRRHQVTIQRQPSLVTECRCKRELRSCEPEAEVRLLEPLTAPRR